MILEAGQPTFMDFRIVPFADLRHYIFYFNNGAVGFGVPKSVVNTDIEA